MVILHKWQLDTQLFTVAVGLKGFQEEATVITEYPRLHNKYSGELGANYVHN